MNGPHALDQALFDDAAEYVVGKKRTGLFGAATVQFEPGDGTRYEFVFVFPTTVKVVSDFEPSPASIERRNWLVAIAEMAPPYPWVGSAVHEDYATEKWGGPRFNNWTGVVVARLLTTIADRLKGDPA